MTRGRLTLIALCLLVLVPAGGCGRDEDEEEPAEAGPRLALAIEPVTGEAPLTVALRADLEGELPTDPVVPCPVVAWTLGDGQVRLVQADCPPGEAPRSFALEYTYAAAGSFEASARLLALDVSSNQAQVLVRGATPTAVAVAGMPGPTVVIGRLGATPPAVALAEATVTAPAAAPAGTTVVGPTVETALTAPPVGTAPTVAVTRAAMATGSPAVPAAATEVAVGPTIELGRTITPAVVTTRVAVATGSPAVPAAATEVAVAPVATPVGPTVELERTVMPPEITPPVAATRIAAATGSPAVPTFATEVVVPPATSAALGTAAAPFEGAPTSPLPGPVRPAPRAIEAPPEAATAPAAGTAPAVAPPPVERTVTGRVLPADLYYLDGVGQLMRLPADGRAPELVADGPVDDFAVSTAGQVAVVRDGEMIVLSPGAGSRVIATDADAPVWSRDGRRLAYAADGGVRVLDAGGATLSGVTLGGAPVAWSRDGAWLLVRAAGTFEAVAVADGTRVALPFGAADEAGWLPDRNVLWMAGPGLRLATFEDVFLLTTLLPDTTGVSDVFARPDRRLLALVDGSTLFGVDLAAGALDPRRIGSALSLPPGADFAWAPDGRVGALAGPGGLTLIDPYSGQQVRLFDTPVARPQWVLSRR